MAKDKKRIFKSFKEYGNYVGGFRLSNPGDNIKPIASLGDTPPKRPGGKGSRGVGLHANTKKKKGTPLYSYLQKQGILKKDK